MTQRNDLLIFGTGDVAELAAYYFWHDLGRETAAFIVDDDYAESSIFAGKPLVPSSQLVTSFNSETCDVFVALAYTKMNRLRREKLDWVRALGFGSTSYISPRATIYENTTFGDNCFILEDNTIQPFVHIGENVTLWSGNHIGHHSVIEDDVFVASQVVVSGGVTIGQGSFVGVNATLRDHISVGPFSVIGAGTLILGDTEPESVYAGAATSPRSGTSAELKRI